MWHAQIVDAEETAVHVGVVLDGHAGQGDPIGGLNLVLLMMRWQRIIVHVDQVGPEHAPSTVHSLRVAFLFLVCG